MPIVTDQGIYTVELCEDSKKYLSRLLVGKTGITPDLLRWELFLTDKFNLNGCIATYQHTQGLSKQTILDHLVTFEIQSFDPKLRKQQAELRSLLIARISVGILVILIIDFTIPFFALGLIGNFALLTAVLCITLATSLIFYSIIPILLGEKLINPEWIKEYDLEKEKWQQKLIINAPSETAVTHEEVEEQISCSTSIQPIQPIKLNKADRHLNADAKHCRKNKIIGSIMRNFSFFNNLPLAEESDANTIYLNSLSSSITFTNKSC